MAKPIDITGGLTITHKPAVMKSPENKELSFYLKVDIETIEVDGEEEYAVNIVPMPSYSKVKDE